MRHDPLYKPITVEEFFDIDFGTDRKFELVDGVIYRRTGGTETHVWVQNNVAAWLRTALRGSGCRAYGSEMGVRVSGIDLRYPDISIHCGPRPEHGANVKALDSPVAVIEILSPSTAMFDQGTKLEEYKAIESVAMIGFIDPIDELVRTVQRGGSSASWLDTNFAVRDLELPALGITLPHAEIFARD